MSTFTLAISCLTTSNLPWFMDLTFQVPMQYCSLQHWTLLLSSVPSTTGCFVFFFCFGSIPSFFLELLLHWSPIAYWAPSDLGSSSFSVLSYCFFPGFSWVCLPEALYLYETQLPSTLANDIYKVRDMHINSSCFKSLFMHVENL